MNTLYISYDGALDPLGSSQIIPYLVGLSRKGVKYTLVTYEKKARLADKIKFSQLKSLLEANQIKWEVLVYHKEPTIPATAYDVISGFFKICKIIFRDKIKLIHARSFVGAVPALLAARLFRLKFLYDNRGFYPEERVDGNIWKKNGFLFRAAKFYEKKFFIYADWIVCLTAKAKEIMQSQDYLQNKRDKIEVIPTCADTEKFKVIPKDERLMAQLGLRDRFVFIYCGSIGTWYMLDEMVDFFLASKNVVTNSFFMILTPDLELVNKKMLSRHIKSDDFLINYVPYDAISNWLSLADVSVSFIKPLFSKKSSCPTKFAESLACGLPVVINSGIGDTEKYVQEYNLGVVLKEFNEKAYISALEDLLKLMRNNDITKTICRKAAEDFFSLDMALNKYSYIYQQFVNYKSERRCL